MTKLHELIAVEGSLQDSANRDLKAATGAFGDPSLFAGMTRNYNPLEEDGDRIASERNLPKVEVNKLLVELAGSFGDYMDVSLQKEVTNTKTCATVVVDGVELLKDLPATALLNLEKKLSQLFAVIKAVPTLDPAVVWHFDENQGFYVSDPKTSYRTEKVLATHVEYEATKEHPAQVQTFSKDVRVGEWTTIHYSAAMPLVEKNEVLKRLENLLREVTKARQRANEAEIEKVKVAEKVFNYLFDWE